MSEMGYTQVYYGILVYLQTAVLQLRPQIPVISTELTPFIECVSSHRNNQLELIAMAITVGTMTVNQWI